MIRVSPGPTKANRSGPRGEDGLDQLALHARQGQVLDIAALAGGAVAEHAGPVADREHAQIRLPGHGHGQGDVLPVRSGDGAARLVADLAGGQLRLQGLAQRLCLDAGAELGVTRQDVVREAVAAEEGMHVIGARADQRDGGRGPGQGQQPAGVVQEHDAALGELAGERAARGRVQVEVAAGHRGRDR